MRGAASWRVAAAAALFLAASHDGLADYVVQVAALADPVFLAESSEKLKAAGFSVVTETFAPPVGRPLTRLMVGPYRERKEAEAAQAKLKGLGWPGYLRPYRVPSIPQARPTPPPPVPSPTPVAEEAKTPPSAPAPTVTPPVAPTPQVEARQEEPPAEEPAVPETPPPETTPAPEDEPPPLSLPGLDEKEGAAPVKLFGFFQTEGAYTVPEPEHWSKFRNTLELGLQGSFGSRVSWKLSGRAAYDAIYDLDDFYPESVRDDQRFESMFRETYLDISAGDFDFRLGRQHIVWGEVIGLFFADVVSAKDLRDFIARDFDLLRIPQWAARAELTRADFHAEVIWIPFMSYDEIGVPGSEFYPSPPAPAGFRVELLDEEKPPQTLENSAYGLRLSYLAGGWDLSAFYYDSVDASPAFFRAADLTATPLPVLFFQPRHDRIWQTAVTVSKDFAKVVLKAEALYTADRWFSVTRLADADGVVRQNSLDYILGIEYPLPRESRINVQLFQRWFPDHDPDILAQDLETGVTFFASTKLLNQKVEPEVLVIRSLNEQGWLARFKVTWRFLDHWRFAAGADWFGGPQNGFFGRYDQKDRVFGELRYTF